MTRSASTPSWETIEAICQDVLSSQSCEKWGDFKVEVARRLEVEVETLRPWKTEMQELVIGAHTGESSKEDCNHQVEALGKEGRSPRDRGSSCRVKNPTENKSRADNVEETEAMKALKQMVRAMCVGPRVFRGLKQMGEREAEETLRQRLLDTGAEFKGAFPSPAEIARAGRKSAREKDLEGIDVSNVLEGSRRRRTPNPIDPPSKKQRQSGGDSSTGHGKGTAGDDSPTSEGDDASADDDDSESECEFS